MGQPMKEKKIHSLLSEFLTQLFAAATATIKIVRRQRKKKKAEAIVPSKN